MGEERAVEANLEYPDAMRGRESAWLGDPNEPRIGIALSGGGIRSATFCLGVFQGLASFGLPRFHFLSTVSGGGYFGAFFGRLFHREYVRGRRDVGRILQGQAMEHPRPSGGDVVRGQAMEHPTPSGGDIVRGQAMEHPRPSGGATPQGQAMEHPRPSGGDIVRGQAMEHLRPSGGATLQGQAEHLSPSGADILRSLRDNSRYLAPRGSGDFWVAAAVLLRNWLAVMTCLFSGFLLLFLTEFLVRVLISEELARPPATWSQSPWWSLANLAFVYVFVPAAWSYWMLPSESIRYLESEPKVSRSNGWAIASAVAPTLVTPIACWFGVPWAPRAVQALAMAAWAGFIALAMFLAIWVHAVVRGVPSDRTKTGSPSRRDAATSMDRGAYARHTSALVVRTGLVAVLVLAAMSALDRGAVALYELVRNGLFRDVMVGAGGGLALAAGTAQRFAVWVDKRPNDATLSLPVRMLADVAGLLVAAGLLLVTRSVAVGIAWRGSPLTTTPDLDALGWMCLAFALLTCCFGRAHSFVNRSGHLPLYTARLVRTYLGASNPQRHGGRGSVLEVQPGDDIAMAKYWNRAELKVKDAPIHLVNVTVNETVDGRTELQHRDRKGIGMAVGPAGVSLGVCHHLVFGEPKGPAQSYGRPTFHAFGTTHKTAFDGEVPSLGYWTGISGAAFSTGLGWRTSLGLSLLTGLANVRLGYWWDSGIVRPRARLISVSVSPWHRLWHWLRRLPAAAFAWALPVYAQLLAELTARFPGTAGRWWYLSDGGHFENLGGYELIRRRLPYVILIDAEADPRGRFEGLANLIHKSRVDFGATIELDIEALVPRAESSPGSGLVGSLARSRAHAITGLVTYADGSTGRLLYLKATVTGTEPTDVLTYKLKHPAFPHESTSDQFFDELQWEAYRCLGHHAASHVLHNLRSDPVWSWLPDGKPPSWSPATDPRKPAAESSGAATELGR